LWPIGETRRVFIETVERILGLMRRYRGFTYAQSTALYYTWLAADRPDLLEEVRARVREGRWEPVGGSWVECDCNMPSGESLVRQFLYGKMVFRELLGVDVVTAWFPDSFGFPSTLPMILRGCGVRYLVIQKLNWNDTTMFPYNLFWWRSPDGSRILVYQMPGGYWGDPGDDRERLRQLLVFTHRHGIQDMLLVYGKGDHGGGPTEEMIRHAEELARSPESHGHIEARHSTATGYMKHIERNYGDKIPEYTGELYLQFHRGTYTTGQKIKHLIHECEQLLQALEMLETLRYIETGKPYDREEMRSLWRRLLTNQFHDTIAGTLSKTPYTAAVKRLEELRRTLQARLPPQQASRSQESDAETKTTGNEITLYNKHLEVVVDRETGWIKSIKTRDGTEYLAPPGIRLELYKDEPILARAATATPGWVVDYVFDAWELYHLQDINGVKYQRLEASEIETGNGKVTETITHRDGVRIRQTISLHGQYIHIDIEAEWNTIHRLLKLAITLNHYAEQVTAGQPYGHTTRTNPASPYSTLHQRAAWETWLHTWLDYSNGEKGLAVITTSLHGYDAIGNTLRLTLLRAPRAPPEGAWSQPWLPQLLAEQPVLEKGSYKFRITLHPHQGDWQQARIPTKAHQLTMHPLQRLVEEKIRVEPDTIHLTALKLAEERDAVIIRLHNPYNKETEAEITLPTGIREAWETNLLEQPQRRITSIKNNTIKTRIPPYSLKTIMAILETSS